MDRKSTVYSTKLFSLLMGRAEPTIIPEPSQKPQTSEDSEISPAENDDAIDENQSLLALSINIERLRRIFKSLYAHSDKSAVDQNAEGDESKKSSSVLNRFSLKNAKPRFSYRSFKIPRPKFRTFLRTKNTDAVPHQPTANWARFHLKRLYKTLRIARNDTLTKKRRNHSGHDKAKQQMSLENSRALIHSASQSAQDDLIRDMEKRLSNRCSDDSELWKYSFPFENIVFEGGGAKMHAYIGAIKCLEEAGIKWKRLAGTSAGALTAGLLAVGYTSEEIHILYEYDVEYYVKDGACGLLSFLPNMLRHYGWNPGERAMRWYGECLAVKTGNPDITFQQVYDDYNVELCVVAVNLSTRCEEYFHPKTTPDMPVKLAVRMSSSLPGLFQPVRQRLPGGTTNVYVDGGLLCNYPVHVFDGWWLSMDPNDVFYKKMESLDNLPKILDRKNRFGEYNRKTLGFCMFSMLDDKALRFEIEKRHKLKVTKRPKTKLSLKRMKLMKKRDECEAHREAKLDALNRFFKVLRKCHTEKGDLTKEALLETFHKLVDEDGCLNDKNSFTRQHAAILFGEDMDFADIVQDLCANSNNAVCSFELIVFLKRHHVDLQEFLGDQILGHVEVSNFGAFFMQIQESLMNSARCVYIQTEDLERTVGINTDYIKTEDFNLQRGDQEFLIQQGYKSTAAFLRHWIHHNHHIDAGQCRPIVQRSVSDCYLDASTYCEIDTHSDDLSTSSASSESGLLGCDLDPQCAFEEIACSQSESHAEPSKAFNEDFLVEVHERGNFD